jgi:hypothetical protein
MVLDRCFKIPIRHGRIIQISLIICAAAYLPLMLAWNKTAWIFGSNHSITLISCLFVLGMISIGSDIVWVPYTANFGAQYLPAYFVGVGLCALFPSVLSLMQGWFLWGFGNCGGILCRIDFGFFVKGNFCVRKK